MFWLIPLALIVAGVIAASTLIISKLPKSKEYLDRLAPIQGIFGVILLVVAVIRLVWLVDANDRVGKLPFLWMLSIYAGIACAVLLGFLLGMPLIAKWIPGNSPAEQKVVDMQQKIVPYQTLIGLVGIGAAILLMYYNGKYAEVLPHL